MAAAQGPEAVEQALVQTWPNAASIVDWVRLRPRHYTRTLVYRDELLEVLVLTWARDARVPIHDHAGQHCWMLGIAGELEIVDYRLVRWGTATGRARVEPVGPPQRLRPGMVDGRTALANLHSVRTADTMDSAVSVHLYNRPIARCRVFDEERDRCEERWLRYDFVGPHRDEEPVHLASPPSL